MKRALMMTVSSCCVRTPWHPPMPPGIHIQRHGLNAWTVSYYSSGNKRPRTIQLDASGHAVIKF